MDDDFADDARALLRTNLAALRAAGAVLPDSFAGPLVKADTTQPGNWLVETALPGRFVRLHSARDPVTEAARLLDAARTGSGLPPTLLVIGFGLGFLVDALEARHESAVIIAVEPAGHAIPPCLARRDLTTWIGSGRLRFVVGPEYHGVSLASQAVAAGPVAVIVSPVLAREWPELLREARSVGDRVLAGAGANDAARRKFAGPYLLNTLRNLPTIERSLDVAALRGALAGIPAVLTAAGPSLDVAIPDMHRAAERAVVISTDTAVKPLVGAGIAPDFAVSVDPQEINAAHLAGVTPRIPTWLVAEGSVHPSTFTPFGERTVVFRIGDHHPWPWLASTGLSRTPLRAWGSVLITAFDLALALGCDPIIFVGADLAYTDARPYCRGTAYERLWAAAAARGATLPDIWESTIQSRPTRQVVDLAGRASLTTDAFVAFRDWLVAESLRDGDHRLVNATGRGILHGGRIQLSSLGDVLAGLGPLRAHPGGILPGLAALRRPPERVVRTAVAPDPATLARWIAFSGETVTREEIQDALQGTHLADTSTTDDAAVPTSAWTKTNHAAPPVPALPSSRFMPERLAANRAIALGEPVGSWASTPGIRLPGEPAFVAALVSDATRAVCTLLGLSQPASGWACVAADIPDARLTNVPLTARFEWSPEAQAAVDLLERCVYLASAFADPTTGTDAEGYLWSMPPSGASPEVSRALPPGADLARRAHHAACLTWMRILPLLEEGGRDEERRFISHLATWFANLAAASGSDRSEAALAISLRDGDGGGASGRLALPGTLATLMRAFTGCVVPAGEPEPRSQAPASVTTVDACVRGIGAAPRILCAIEVLEPTEATLADPRRRFFAVRTRRWRRPRVIGVPGAYAVGMLDGGRAFATLHATRHSVIVDRTGVVGALPEWPHPIVAEVRGAGTAGIAWWNENNPYLMRRRSCETESEIAAVAFRPVRAVLLADGTSYWTSATGGLWVWPPDGPVSCAAMTPPVAGLHAMDGGLRIDPALSRGQSRAPEATAWMWRPGEDTLEPIGLGAEGAARASATSRGLTAVVYPMADLIRIADVVGPRIDIACEWPVDAAWCGDGLLVVTAHGTVLLFDDVRGLVR